MTIRPMFLAAATAFVALPIGAFLGAQAKAQSSETYQYLDLFGEVLELVKANYVEDVDDKDLIEAAINGMLTSLDPHSGFLGAESFQDMQVQTKGEFGGLGFEVTMENGFVKVVSPIDDTPAFRAGVKAGDFITHLDGEAVLGLTLSDAVERMRGKVGAPLDITVRREGRDPFDITKPGEPNYEFTDIDESDQIGLTSFAAPRFAIFDLDGLLIDSEPLWRLAEVEILNLHCGEALEQERRRERASGDLIRHVSRIVRHANVGKQLHQIRCLHTPASHLGLQNTLCVAAPVPLHITPNKVKSLNMVKSHLTESDLFIKFDVISLHRRISRNIFSLRQVLGRLISSALSAWPKRRPWMHLFCCVTQKRTESLTARNAGVT